MRRSAVRLLKVALNEKVFLGGSESRPERETQAFTACASSPVIILKVPSRIRCGHAVDERQWRKALFGVWMLSTSQQKHKGGWGSVRESDKARSISLLYTFHALLHSDINWKFLVPSCSCHADFHLHNVLWFYSTCVSVSTATRRPSLPVAVALWCVYFGLMKNKKQKKINVTEKN